MTKISIAVNIVVNVEDEVVYNHDWDSMKIGMAEKGIEYIESLNGKPVLIFKKEFK